MNLPRLAPAPDLEVVGFVDALGHAETRRVARDALAAYGEVETALAAESFLARQERELATAAEQSTAARQLAERENAAVRVGGVSLEDKDEVLASVLLDLSQTATIQSSLDVGDRMLGHLDRVAELHKIKVQQAGVRVLRAHR